MYSYFLGGWRMDFDLQERVMLERVELIARMTSEGACRERDREIALMLIADLVAKVDFRTPVFNVTMQKDKF